MNSTLILIIFFMAPAISAKSVNLKEVSQLYLQSNELLSSLKAELDFAINEEIAAGRRLFPSISWVSSVTQQETSNSLYESDSSVNIPGLSGGSFFPKKVYTSVLSFNQPIYMGGKIWQAWKFKEQSAKIAKFNMLEQEQNLMVAFVQKVVSLHVAKQVKIVMLESQKLQRQFLELVKKRRQRGATKDYEVFQAQGGFYSYVSKIQQQQSLIESLELNLANDLDLLVDKLPVIDLPMPDLAGKKIRDEKEPEGIEARPDVQLALQSVELAKIEKKLTMGEHYPTLSLQGTWGYEDKNTQDFFSSDSQKHLISLKLSIPLFSGLDSIHLRRAQESKLSAAKLNLKNKIDLAKMEQQASQQKLVLALAVFEANKKWLDQAKQALDKGFRKYKLGIIPTFQLVQLQREYEGAALSFWSSLQSFYQEKIQRLKSKGLRISQSI